MDGEEKMKNFWKSEFFLKLASVFAAILLWIFVVYQENPIHETWLSDLPVSYVNHSSNLQNGKLLITEGKNSKVDLKIRGRRNELASAKASNITCTVDLGNISGEGSYTLPIDVNIAANGVELVSKDPYSVTVVVDKVVTKEKEVTVNITGTAKNGFVAGEIESSPTSVKLTGPQSLINSVETAVSTVDVTDASEDIQGLYKIKLYDASGKEITDETISKNIEYCDIKCPVFSTKEVSIMPFLSEQTNYLGQAVTVVSKNPSVITLVGRKEKLDQIDTIFTETISAYDILGTVTLKVNLDFGGIPNDVYAQGNVNAVELVLMAEPDNSEQSGENGQNTGKNENSGKENKDANS